MPIHVPSFKLIEGQIKELQGVVPNTPPAENDQKSPSRIGLLRWLTTEMKEESGKMEHSVQRSTTFDKLG